MPQQRIRARMCPVEGQTGKVKEISGKMKKGVDTGRSIWYINRAPDGRGTETKNEAGAAEKLLKKVLDKLNRLW